MDTSIISIIIIAITIISFAMNKIPIAMTSMLAALAMGISGSMGLGEIYKGFGSVTVMMVIGMIIVGDSLFQTGVAQKMGNTLLKSGLVKSERSLVIIVVIVACVLSAFTSNSAVVAMFIPLIRSVANKSNGKIQSKHVVMGLGQAAVLGGTCTLVGSTPQLVAQSILIETEGTRAMTFFELGKLAIPLCILLVIYHATIGYKIQKKVLADVTTPSYSEDELAITQTEVPKWKAYLSSIIMILCVVGFVAGVWNVGVIALLGASILITTGVVDFKESMRNMDWQTIVVIGSAQGFAEGLDNSGGGALIANFIINLFGSESASPILLLGTLIVIGVVLTTFMQNTAVVAMLVPIAIQIAFSLDVNPMAFAVAVTVAASVDCATPIGTAANTQTLVEGYRFMDYIKIGGPIVAIMTVAMVILAPIVYGL